MQSHHHHHHHSGPTATMAASPHQVVSLAAGPSPQDMSSSVQQQQQQQGGHGHIMSSGKSSGSPGKQERPEGKEGIGSPWEIQRSRGHTGGPEVLFYILKPYTDSNTHLLHTHRSEAQAR